MRSLERDVTTARQKAPTLAAFRNPQRKGYHMKRFAIVGALAVVFMILCPLGKSAHASETLCTVTSVGWQKHTTGVNYDLLLIGCSDGAGYAAYIGSATDVGKFTCWGSADAVKSLESMAVAARLSGKQLDIYWTTRSCPGNAGQKSIDSLYLM
jgi:hypothetical protein